MLKSNVLLKIILSIILIIIISIAIIIAILLKNIENVENPKLPQHIDFSKIDKVENRNEYYAIKTIIEKYYNAINNLNANIEDLDIMIDINSKEEEKKIIEQYTLESQKILEDMIDKECISYLSLNQNNMVSIFEKYKNSNYSIQEMYYVEKNINTNLYYVEGLLDNIKEFSLIIKVDIYTNTFSIYTQDYIEKNQYDKMSIEKYFNIDTIEYIEKNDNNKYIENNITDQMMAQYYLYDYGDKVINNEEKAYELLDEEYKKNRFPDYEEYKKYIEKSKKRYNLLQLSEYSIEKYEKYIEFICKDQYGDIYIFKDTGIMKYTLQLDDYTLPNEKFDSKYNNSSLQNKGILNIDKFFKMINMQDYKVAYNLLNEDFKQMNFKTVDEFEKYMEQLLFNNNKVYYESYSNEISSLHIYKIKITDALGESQKIINMNIVIDFLEGTDFVMSFSIE